MSFDKDTLLGAFTSIQPVELSSASDLPKVEDSLAQALLPEPVGTRGNIASGLNAWAHRVPLEKSLRSNGKFIGQLVGIVIEPIVDPYATLCEERARYIGNALGTQACGFIVSASLRSSAHGDLGTAKRSVWLVPRSPQQIHMGLYARVISKEQGTNGVDKANSLSKRRSTEISGGKLGKRPTGRQATLRDGSEKNM